MEQLMAAQAWIVTERIGRRLGLDLHAAPAQLRMAPSPSPGTTAAELAAALDRCGAAVQLAWLRRTVDAASLTRLASAGDAPVVIVTEEEGHAVAWLLEAADGDQGRLTRVDAFGHVREEAVSVATWASRGGAGVLALVPMPVAPADDGHAPGHVSPVRRLLHLLGRERGDIGVIYFYAGLAGLFSLAAPLSVQAIVQLVSGGLILQPVVLLITFVILATIVAGVLQLLQLHVVEVLQRRLFARLAFEFTFRIPRLRLEVIQNEDLPELMNRFFEVLSIQKALSKLLTETTAALLQVVFGLVLLTFYHPYFTILGFALAGGLYLVFRLTGAKGLETSLQESKYKYRVAYWLEELARTVRTFKFAGTSTLPMRRMDGEIASYLTYRAKHFRVLVQQGVSILVFKTLLTGGLLILGSMLVIDNRISLGQFVASEIVIVLVLGALEKVILSLETVYDILTAVDKAGHVGDLPVEDDGGQAPLAPASGAGMTVLLRQAGYRYPGAPAPALSGLSLDLAAGSRVAVTGFDGAGQTTLLKLLGGLYESHEGAVAHDGVSLHDIDRRLLRARIGLVLETNELFDGTIEENISVGRPEVGTERVLRALAQVGLQEYLLALPRGLGTPIRARGLELPQTVGRKLQLARAIAGDPALLLVDDVVQHFDIASRRQVVRALTDPAAPWTLVTATHDPMLLAAMDRVLVLDQGRLHRDGTYLEVLRDPYVQGIILPAAELAGSAA